jgi:hypothetical protein
MKIRNVTDVEKFFETIEKCKGRVELVTSDGDVLNLKSKLSQYFSLTKVFTDAKIDDVDIICYEPEDINLLMEFLIRG